ncbi:hypothetical protein A5gp_00063 [Alteromonas phage vB_AemP_PT15-A5]|nr:hypothetical protein A5gp_00063 [Alteromonas phage vB_AemP_PT15-A5]
MNQTKTKLFNQLKQVFPQPHLMKSPEKRISWSVAIYISKASNQEKAELKEVGNINLASQYVKWMEQQHGRS